MQRLRISIMLSIVGLGLWLMATPVFADPGQNPGQKGQNCPGGQGCPGGPNLPESHLAVSLPIIALVLVCTVICVVYFRQRARLQTAE